MNENSILNTVKDYLGILPEDKSFDKELIMLINSNLPVLTEIGLGPENGFMITGESEGWDSFVDLNDLKILQMVKGCISMRVKIQWDAGSSPSFVIDILKDQIKEFEWRLQAIVDPGKKVSP